MSKEVIKRNYRFLGLKRIFPEPKDETIGQQYRDFSPKVFYSTNFKDRDRLEMRFLRQTLVQIFGVKNLYQIFESTQGSEGEQNKAVAYKNFITDYPTIYGLTDLSFKEKELLIKSALEKANDAIRLFDNPETGILRNLKTSIGIINEIEARNNPIELILIMFDPQASRRMRYEARRKLIFMDLAFKSNFELEEKAKQMDDFLKFLDVNFWDGGTGQTEKVEVVSDHSIDNYACTNIHILSPHEKISVSDYRRYNKFSMRKWSTEDEKPGTVYFEDRLKDPIGLIFKMMRKDIKNPNEIDDYIGLKLVFKTKKDIYDFLETLQVKSAKVGTMITFDNISDTIDNNDMFRVINKGSSNKFEVVKVDAILNGTKVEFMLHTFRTYMDSRYHDEFGLEQYVIKRMFDSGLMDMIYPYDIYHEDIMKYRNSILRERINHVRTTSNVDIPANRRKEKEKLIRYSSDLFILDMVNIMRQLEERPEVIIAVGHSGGFMASLLSKLLGGVHIEYKTENEKIDPEKYRGKKVLIVNGIAKDGRKIKKLKNVFPDSKVAVIGIREQQDETNKLINYKARIIRKNTWLRYYWELPEIEVSLSQGLILFYKIENGQVLFLVEETNNVHNGNDNKLKLIGGKHEKKDIDLLATSLRELREETGVKMPRNLFTSLSNLSFDFEKSNEDQANILKGFSQAFALKVDQNFRLKKKEKNIGNYTWVNTTDFKKRSLWQSYVKGIDTWVKEIEKIEDLNQN